MTMIMTMMTTMLNIKHLYDGVEEDEGDDEPKHEL